MFLAVILSVFIGCAAVAAWYFKHRHLYKHTEHIPGPPTFPFIGNALQFGTSPISFLNCIIEATKTYGPITRIWIGSNKIYILVSDPALAEHLLSSPKYIHKSVDYKLLTNWLGNGLLISTGSHWQKRRKIITPTFHFKILEQFIPIFNAAGDILVEKFNKEVNNEIIDVYPFVTAYALDVICETAMGTSVNAQNNPNNEYCTAIRTMGNIFMERIFSFWKQYDTLYPLSKEYKIEQNCLLIIHSFTQSVIEKRREQLTANLNNIKERDENEGENDVGSKKKIAFLDVLLQSTIDGKPLTNEDIAAEVDTFMFEGHDTTASAISFALYEISKNSQVQDKIVEELSSIFADDPNRNATIRDLNDMKYIDCVSKETLRMYPSVPYYGRLLEEDIHFNGKIYPKGAMMSIIPISLHKNPKLYKNPDIFNPDRFMVENLESKHPFAYLPFSAGPRNCIGQKFAMYEIKSTIAKIVRNFELFPVDSKYNPVLSGESILKSANGIFLKLKIRE